jgi:hypothetical protein
MSSYQHRNKQGGHEEMGEEEENWSHINFYWAFDLLPSVNDRNKWHPADRAEFVSYVKGKYNYDGSDGPRFGLNPVIVSLRVQGRPARYDVDNIIKPFLDAITASKSVWVDDSQIVDLRIEKCQSNHSSIICTVAGRGSDLWIGRWANFAALFPSRKARASWTG